MIKYKFIFPLFLQTSNFVLGTTPLLIDEYSQFHSIHLYHRYTFAVNNCALEIKFKMDGVQSIIWVIKYIGIIFPLLKD